MIQLYAFGYKNVRIWKYKLGVQMFTLDMGLKGNDGWQVSLTMTLNANFKICEV